MDVLFAVSHGVSGAPLNRPGGDNIAQGQAVPATAASSNIISKAALMPAAGSERSKKAEDNRTAASTPTPPQPASMYATKMTYEAEFDRTFLDLVDRGDNLLSRFPPEQLVRLIEETQSADATIDAPPEPAERKRSDAE